MNTRHSPLQRLRNGTSAIALVWALAGLTGCVGVPYKRPSVATPSAFKEDAPSAYRGAAAGTWRPAQPQAAALKGRWWQAFGDPELNGLEEQLNAGNQNIATAFESFMAARAQVSEAGRATFRRSRRGPPTAAPARARMPPVSARRRRPRPPRAAPIPNFSCPSMPHGSRTSGGASARPCARIAMRRR